MYTGAGWGVDQWADDPRLILNQADVAGLQHDKDMNEWKWLQNTWTTNPPVQSVGPIGTAFSVLGSLPFLAQAAYDREIPFLWNYKEKPVEGQAVRP